MVSILGDTEQQWNTFDREYLNKLQKESWVQARAIQANPTCNVIRRSFNGKIASALTYANMTNSVASTGLALPCAVSNYEINEDDTDAGKIATGDRKFVAYDFEIRRDDVIEFPADSKAYWEVVTTVYRSESGRAEAQIRLLKQKPSGTVQ